MKAENLQQIETPTLLVDEEKARKNLKHMAAKAAAEHIRFRPRFKTHQSAQIGEWFREEGITAITVSSLSMAAYFAEYGWNDILVAFPVNLREMAAIQRLAAEVHLGLLVESPEAVAALGEQLASPVDIWIKVDTGLHRAGLDVNDVEAVRRLTLDIQRFPNLNLRGLLTHAGQTYHAHSTGEIKELYAQSWQALVRLRDELYRLGMDELELSVGDTPGCWLSDSLGQVDEIRPGNFIFFDSMMADLGVCSVEEIAVAVACPVVALHPQRSEVVVYGGAIHLSKEALVEEDGKLFYGYVAFLTGDSWQFTGRENKVIALSQEHGVLRMKPSDFSRLKIGDLVGILPVHSCLAVDCLKK
jgi:D-serine deaminase-like pyridoxal phosphate-dependent protein